MYVLIIQITIQVFVGNPLEEESTTAQKYIDDVIKRLLFLKKLDGYPVIRDMDNDEDEEVNSLLDMEEIEKMAKGEDDTSGSEEEEEDEAPPPQEDQRAVAEDDDDDLSSNSSGSDAGGFGMDEED